MYFLIFCGNKKKFSLRRLLFLRSGRKVYLEDFKVFLIYVSFIIYSAGDEDDILSISALRGLIEAFKMAAKIRMAMTDGEHLRLSWLLRDYCFSYSFADWVHYHLVHTTGQYDRNPLFWSDIWSFEQNHKFVYWHNYEPYMMNRHRLLVHNYPNLISLK